MKKEGTGKPQNPDIALDAEVKNAWLQHAAAALIAESDGIIAENKKDLAAATDHGLSDAEYRTIKTKLATQIENALKDDNKTS